jgi:transposase
MKTQPILEAELSFIGIDYHKRYSVFCVLDAQGMILDRGRIDHLCPEQFVWLVRRWPGCRVVFEACMNWHWLLEILEEVMPREDIVLANPFKTGIRAEAQIKTDKVDARILGDLLRANLIAKVQICGKATRDLKEMLRQRCFFVRQRTMVRNRIHRLLGAQHGLKLPQCSDLFGAKGLSFLDKLELAAPAGLLLTQQLTLLRELALRIREDEKALEAMIQVSRALHHVRSLPGMGPILAAVVVTEIDTIERFPSAQKLCGYAGLCPSTSSRGAKTFQGKLLPRCNKWLRSRFCGGRLGGGGMLALFWGLLSPQALRGQEGQQRSPGHRPADGPHHLATLDAESRLRELPHGPRTPMPASLRELLPGRPGKGKAAFSQSQEADFFTTDFPQPLRGGKKEGVSPIKYISQVAMCC